MTESEHRAGIVVQIQSQNINTLTNALAEASFTIEQLKIKLDAAEAKLAPKDSKQALP